MPIEQLVLISGVWNNFVKIKMSTNWVGLKIRMLQLVFGKTRKSQSIGEVCKTFLAIPPRSIAKVAIYVFLFNWSCRILQLSGAKCCFSWRLWEIKCWVFISVYCLHARRHAFMPWLSKCSFIKHNNCTLFIGRMRYCEHSWFSILLINRGNICHFFAYVSALCAQI